MYYKRAGKGLIPPEHRKSLKGSLAKHLKVRLASIEEWDKARENAWHQAWKEKAGLDE